MHKHTIIINKLKRRYQVAIFFDILKKTVLVFGAALFVMGLANALLTWALSPEQETPAKEERMEEQPKQLDSEETQKEEPKNKRLEEQLEEQIDI